MIRTIFIGAALIAAGAAAGFVLSSRIGGEAARPEEPTRVRELASSRGFPASGETMQADRRRSDLERRVRALEAKLDAVTAERRTLEARLEALNTRLAESKGSGATPNSSGAAPQAAASAPVAPAEAPIAPPADAAAAVDYSKSPQERALIAAGIDDATAAEIKRHDDDLTMAAIYLRDQATRENWLDSPRFHDEMASIEAERTSIRDEIGDDAYDHYLYALGQTNRVRVDEVIAESPAAEAGLQAGDMIVRYGETRLFNPGELVEETHGGTPGEMVRVEVVRNGQRFEVQVPRGPLGLRTAPTQDKPQTG